MRDAVLPALMLCIAFGVLLGFSRRRDSGFASAVLVFCAVAASAIVPPLQQRAGLLIACWSAVATLSIGIIAARPGRWNAWILALGGLLCGSLVGAVIASEGHAWDLAKTLPFSLVWIPAAALASRRAIILRVLAGWMIALSLISIGLVAVSGHQPPADHLE